MLGSSVLKKSHFPSYKQFDCILAWYEKLFAKPNNIRPT